LSVECSEAALFANIKELVIFKNYAICKNQKIINIKDFKCVKFIKIKIFIIYRKLLKFIKKNV